MKRGVLLIALAMIATFLFLSSPTSLTSPTGWFSISASPCPGTILADYTLLDNLTTTTTCIDIGADDITVDCNGFTINWATGGASTQSGIRSIASYDNITIKNCILSDINSAGSNGIGIDAVFTNSQIINNTIYTNGTSGNSGIRLTANNTLATNNTIFATGTSISNLGIDLLGGMDNNITDNYIRTSGTSANYGISVTGGPTTTQNFVNNNTIQTIGTASRGLYIVAQGNNTFSNNTITIQRGEGVLITTGQETNATIENNSITTFNGTGILTSASNFILRNNTITATGIGMWLTGPCTSCDGAINAIITGNHIMTNGTGGPGINATHKADNILIENNTIITNGTRKGNRGILLNASNAIIRNNNIQTNGVGASSRENYGVFIFFNSNNSILNNSISTFGADTNYGIYANRENNSNIDGNIISTNGSTGCCNYGIFLSTVVNGTIDNNTVSTNGASTSNEGIIILIQSYNVLMSNNTILAGGSDSNTGIRVSSSNNNSAINNSISTNGNSGNKGIYFDTVINNTIRDNVISTGGLVGGGNEGIYLLFPSSGSIDVISGNNISTTGGSGNNYGLNIYQSSHNSLQIDNNVINTSGNGGFNSGVLIYLSNPASLSNNSITTNGTGAENHGLNLILSGNNTFSNNIVSTNGSDSNYGLNIQSSQYNLLENNSIQTDGTTGGNNKGIFLSSATWGGTTDNNTIQNNSITTQGAAGYNFGIHLDSNSNSTLIQNNTITSDSTQNFSHGIFIQSSQNNQIANNTISAPASLSDAISLLSSTATTIINNTLLAFGRSGLFLSSSLNTLAENSSFAGTAGLIVNETDAQIDFNNVEITTPVNFSQVVEIATNFTRVNSTSASALNVSAVIALRNLLFESPRVLVDYEDDGTYSYCTQPTCNNLSYTSGVFTFNVSSFSTYSSAEHIPFNGTTSVSLTNVSQGTSFQVSINVTCIDLFNCSSSSITLDPFQVIGNLTDPTSSVPSVFADADFIYGASFDGNLYVWNKTDNTLYTTLFIAGAGAQFVHADSDYIYTGGFDSSFKVFNRTDLTTPFAPVFTRDFSAESNSGKVRTITSDANNTYVAFIVNTGTAPTSEGIIVLNKSDSFNEVAFLNVPGSFGSRSITVDDTTLYYAGLRDCTVRLFNTSDFNQASIDITAPAACFLQFDISVDNNFIYLTGQESDYSTFTRVWNKADLSLAFDLDDPTNTYAGTSVQPMFSNTYAFHGGTNTGFTPTGWLERFDSTGTKTDLTTYGGQAVQDLYCDSSGLYAGFNLAWGDGEVIVFNESCVTSIFAITQFTTNPIQIGINTPSTCSANVTSSAGTVSEVNFTVIGPDSLSLANLTSTFNGLKWVSQTFTPAQFGTHTCQLTTLDNQSNYGTANLNFVVGQKGAIPVGAGTPFYTTSNNPVVPVPGDCLYNFAPNTSCQLTWNVVATGTPGTTWQMFALVNGSQVNTTPVNVTIIAAASSSSSGGGSSPLRATNAVVTTQQASKEYAMQTDSYVTQQLSKSDTVTFTIADDLHTLTVLEINQQTVTIRIQSTIKEYILQAGQTKQIDLTSDGTPDVIVRVESLKSSGVIFSITKMNQEAPINNTQTTPKSEHPIIQLREIQEQPEIQRPQIVTVQGEIPTNRALAFGIILVLAVLTAISFVILKKKGKTQQQSMTVPIFVEQKSFTKHRNKRKK